MDEKTARLRDIFVELAGNESVTETQQEARGSLAGGHRTDDRLAAVINTLRDRYEFRTSLSNAALVAVVRGFYAGDGDTAIASELGEPADAETVKRARIDLHLVADRDLEASFDL
ncbi:MAG: conditioned medium-induced protein 4, partial [Halobacteriales archaeon]|nr:conditioned medium-induced protein 4 [Halobacteriales archaeon]